MVSSCARGQARIQAALRPAMWAPGLNRAHSYRETWQLPGNVTLPEVVDDIVRAVVSLDRKFLTETIFVDKTDREKGYVRIFAFTKAEWLDIIEIDLSEGKVTSYSSGFLPVCIPLSFLFNSIVFFFPFFDMMLNNKRVEILREEMEVRVVWRKGGKDCFHAAFF